MTNPAPARHDSDSNLPTPTPVGSGCDPSKPRPARVAETSLASGGSARPAHIGGKAGRAPIHSTSTPFPATPGLTLKQRECLIFIVGHIAAHRVSPSYDEIAADIGLRSKSGVHRLMVGLRSRDYVTFTPNINRSVRVSSDAMSIDLFTVLAEMHVELIDVYDRMAEDDAHKKILKSKLAAWRAAVTA